MKNSMIEVNPLDSAPGEAELLRTAALYFADRLFTRAQRKKMALLLDVTAQPIRIPITRDMLMGKKGLMGHAIPTQFELTVSTAAGIRDAMEVVAHEMVHMSQAHHRRLIVTKKKRKYDDGKRLVHMGKWLTGKAMPIEDLEWQHRPWEIEACHWQRILVEEFVARSVGSPIELIIQKPKKKQLALYKVATSLSLPTGMAPPVPQAAAPHMQPPMQQPAPQQAQQPIQHPNQQAMSPAGQQMAPPPAPSPIAPAPTAQAPTQQTPAPVAPGQMAPTEAAPAVSVPVAPAPVAPTPVAPAPVAQPISATPVAPAQAVPEQVAQAPIAPVPAPPVPPAPVTSEPAIPEMPMADHPAAEMVPPAMPAMDEADLVAGLDEPDDLDGISLAAFDEPALPDVPAVADVAVASMVDDMAATTPDGVGDTLAGSMLGDPEGDLQADLQDNLPDDLTAALAKEVVTPTASIAMPESPTSPDSVAAPAPVAMAEPTAPATEMPAAEMPATEMPAVEAPAPVAQPSPDASPFGAVPAFGAAPSSTPATDVSASDAAPIPVPVAREPAQSAPEPAAPAPAEPVMPAAVTAAPAPAVPAPVEPAMPAAPAPAMAEPIVPAEAETARSTDASMPSLETAPEPTPAQIMEPPTAEPPTAEPIVTPTVPPTTEPVSTPVAPAPMMDEEALVAMVDASAATDDVIMVEVAGLDAPRELVTKSMEDKVNELVERGLMSPEDSEAARRQ